MGRMNRDGSQNTYDTRTRSWTLGRQQRQGTQNRYHTQSRRWEMNVPNPLYRPAPLPRVPVRIYPRPLSHPQRMGGPWVRIR
ncbi:MAG: hypothetical protein GX130_06620 [Candidatus Hydrogenedens sp.]|nr:hypothetical protein [Candidatus Hydrogenedens sp.]